MRGEDDDRWKTVALGEVAELVMGQAPPGSSVRDWNAATEDDGRPGLPFVQGNAEFGSRFPAPKKWCVEPGKIAEPGDYLISVRAPVGALNEVDQRLAIGRGLAAIRFHGLHPRFGWQALWEARSAFERVSQGSTFEAINSRDLATLVIPKPSSAEQVSIANMLDAIDEAIEKTESVIAATEDLRKALLQELLTRGVPGWHTEWKTVPGIGTIPVCWELVRLGEVAVEPIRNGFSAGTLDHATGWWLLTLGAVSHRGFVPAGAKPTIPDAHVKSFALRPGDLLVSRSNTSDRVGFAGIYTGTPSNCSYPDLLMRVRVDPGRALVELVEAQLLSGRGRTYFQQQARGTSSSMVKITGDILRAFPLVLPCVEEQRKILDVAAAVHLQLTNLTDGRAALGELKATTSDALLSGRVRVPVPEGGR